MRCARGDGEAGARLSGNEKSIEGLASILRSRGLDITPERFIRLVLDAIVTYSPESMVHSAGELTSAERAAYEEGGFDLVPRATEGGGPLERSAAEYTAMIIEALTVRDAARLLRISPRSVQRQIASRKLYAIRASIGWVLPRFQFDGERELPGLHEVLCDLEQGLHPLSVKRFFLTPQADLRVAGDEQPLTPRDWLLLGRSPKDVARLAACMVLI